MTAITADMIRAAIAMPLEVVSALEAQLGRARMLDHALSSRDENFQLAAAFTVEVVTVVNILNAAERARQAGKRATAAALSARFTKLLTAARRAVSN
jgi:hypothetical protein